MGLHDSPWSDQHAVKVQITLGQECRAQAPAGQPLSSAAGASAQCVRAPPSADIVMPGSVQWPMS